MAGGAEVAAEEEAKTARESAAAEATGPVVPGAELLDSIQHQRRTWTGDHLFGCEDDSDDTSTTDEGGGSVGGDAHNDSHTQQRAEAESVSPGRALFVRTVSDDTEEGGLQECRAIPLPTLKRRKCNIRVCLLSPEEPCTEEPRWGCQYR